MNSKLFSAVVFAVVTGALTGCGGSGQSSTPPAAPVPQTWNLQAGASSNQEALQSLSFYPNSITIDAGDTVTWTFPSNGEPHTVTFLGPRTTLPSPNDPSDPIPAGGPTYDGTVYTNSGFVLGGKTYSLKFTKPGVYPFYCLLHGGMSGTITVQAAGVAYPQNQSAVNAAIATAQQADLASASLAVSQFPYAAGGKQLAAGISAGLVNGKTPGSVFRFLDGPSLSDTSVTVQRGSSITWTNLTSNELHTVTFGVAGQPFPKMDPFSPPSGGSTYDGTAVVNSGILLPGQSYTLTFTTPGTYTYHCLLHDDGANMIGTVTVQ